MCGKTILLLLFLCWKHELTLIFSDNFLSRSFFCFEPFPAIFKSAHIKYRKQLPIDTTYRLLKSAEVSVSDSYSLCELKLFVN